MPPACCFVCLDTTLIWSGEVWNLFDWLFALFFELWKFSLFFSSIMSSLKLRLIFTGRHVGSWWSMLSDFRRVYLVLWLVLAYSDSQLTIKWLYLLRWWLRFFVAFEKKSLQYCIHLSNEARKRAKISLEPSTNKLILLKFFVNKMNVHTL